MIQKTVFSSSITRNARSVTLVPKFGTTLDFVVLQTKRKLVSDLRPNDVTPRKLFRGTYFRRTDGSLIGTHPMDLEYGIRATTGGLLDEKQLQKILEYFRLKKKQNVISAYAFNLVPDHPIKRKPIGARMGGGRGEIVSYGKWVAEGDVFVEFDSTKRDDINLIARTIVAAMPIGGELVTKTETRFLRDYHLIPKFVSDRIQRLEVFKRSNRPVKRHA